MDFISIKDIYKKVAALQRLSENNDNENEAAGALRLAHELAEKYDLTVGQCAAYLKGSKDGRLFMAQKLYNCEPSWTRHKSRYTVSMKREPGWEWQRWEKGHCASCAVKLGQRNNTVSVQYPDGDKRGWKAIGSKGGAGDFPGTLCANPKILLIHIQSIGPTKENFKSDL